MFACCPHQGLPPTSDADGSRGYRPEQDPPRRSSCSKQLYAVTRREVDRAALIGRLAQRDDATWLAELLIEIETDPASGRSASLHCEGIRKGADLLRVAREPFLGLRGRQCLITYRGR